MVSSRVRFRSLFLVLSLCIALTPVVGAADSGAELAGGLQGGLVVQLGSSDTSTASELSLTGRYLIHVMDADPERVDAARVRLRKDGYYGLAWAERLRDQARLPYAENVVNAVVIQDFALPLGELKRVLTPGGRLIVHDQDVLGREELSAAGFHSFAANGQTLVARNPWPKAMDVWSHPRHGADGNAVSRDTLVGPPDRVRWVAAATSEVEGLVTAGGRNFYGGLLARDSFNGLRLWHRDLRRPDQHNTSDFELPKLAREGARPIASDSRVFTLLKDRPAALDAATGELLFYFGEIVKPSALVHAGGRVFISDVGAVYACDAASGQILWTAKAADPRNLATDGKLVTFVRGRVRRGEDPVAVSVQAADGTVKWERDDYPWLKRTTRTVMADGQLVFECSTLNDHDAGNGIHVVSATTGEHQWSREYPPGMNHARQARAMFLNGDLWILHGGKTNTRDKEQMKRQAVQVSALNPSTGETRVTYPAGLAHCFPPVATPNFMFAGELDMTNLKSGEVIANRITKANCSRENGWVPANGLVYTTPKHCTCWPMLRGFVAMAPAPLIPSAARLPVDQIEFVFERGPATLDDTASPPAADDWPMYRHDRWRSGSTSTTGPQGLKPVWVTRLDDADDPAPEGPIMHDWRDNPVVKGPLSPPTIANGLAYVTRPNAHELIAVDTATGQPVWRFTANGRLDTPPAVHRGLCLFGCASGWVYAVRADNGQTVWKLRAAPSDERIVAYGQVESPWPVPGAVLVMDDIAYFAAGRQPLADGGILVFAVDPMTGDRHWVRRIDTVPQKGFYENSGLEFDPFDILHAEGDSIAMSRWIISPDGKDVDVDKWNAFARLNTGAGEVWIPRGSWTYGARHQDRFRGEAPRRPLIAFRDDNIYSSLNGTTDVFRRDFDLDKGEEFNSRWITGWKASSTARSGGKPYRTWRIAEKSKWKNDPFAKEGEEKEEPPVGTQVYNLIHALAMADDRLYAVHQDGRLKVLSTSDGYVVAETQVPTPAWDGLAIAENRVFLTTQDGKLMCLGE